MTLWAWVFWLFVLPTLLGIAAGTIALILAGINMIVRTARGR